ncbi:hypothetical protein ACFO0M_07285 [Micromonospora mangrovi]|uniref:Antitoxin n=2 Tax=Micromonospora TaxID=1873 RepID=A0AAU8HCT7_9ACTN
MDAIEPADVAKATERAEDSEDVAAALAALARIESGDRPIALGELRAELGL